MQLKEGMEAEALAQVAQSVSRRLQQRVTELATPSTAHTAAADPGGAVAGATSMDEPPPDDVVDEEVEEAPVASSSPTGADRTKAADSFPNSQKTGIALIHPRCQRRDTGGPGEFFLQVQILLSWNYFCNGMVWNGSGF